MDKLLDIEAATLGVVLWYALGATAVVAVTHALTSWLTSLQARLRGRTRFLGRVVPWIPVVQIGAWIVALAVAAWFLADAPAIVVLLFVIPLVVIVVIGSRDFARDAIAGAILAFEHSILAGDIVHVAAPQGEISGRIVAIGVRRTLLLTNENAEIFLPNQTLLNSTVRTNPEHALDSPIEISISLEEDDVRQLEELRHLAIDAACCSPYASLERRPEFFVEKIDGAPTASLVAYAFSPEFVRHLESDILESLARHRAAAD